MVTDAYNNTIAYNFCKKLSTLCANDRYAALLTPQQTCLYYTSDNLADSTDFEMFYYNDSDKPSMRLTYSYGDVCASNTDEFYKLQIDIICNKSATQNYPQPTYVFQPDPCLT